MRKINYSLFVSDFDGTLVKRDKTISEEDKKTISNCFLEIVLASRTIFNIVACKIIKKGIEK